MIVPDINLLLYAYDSDSPFHGKATAWWQACLSGDDPSSCPRSWPSVFFASVPTPCLSSPHDAGRQPRTSDLGWSNRW